MPTSTPLPTGQVLTSTALTPIGIEQIFATLTCGMLGIIPPDYSLVRVGWQTLGQPFQTVNNDICYLSAVEVDDNYNRIRDQKDVPNNIQSVTTIITYTRVWEINWCLYGPNSFDRARQIRDSLFLDWTHDALVPSDLYLVSSVERPLRAPEYFQAQWWERVDLKARFNEGVTDTITYQTVISAEVIGFDNETVGEIFDITAHK
jgi:hypothetical protein